MKKFVKKIINNNVFPFILLFIVMIFIHLNMDVTTGDFNWFKNSINDKNLLEFLNFRYHSWSSRLIIESLLVSITQLPSIFYMVIDSLCFTMVGMLISKLFVKKGRVKFNYLIVVFLLMYPILDMSSAGWVATTTNYLWPLLFMLISFIPIRNYFDGKKDKWYMNFVYIIYLLFSCNQEQTCAITFGVYLLFIIYLFIKKKINLYYLSLFILSLLSLLFIITCPGNTNRNLIEIGNCYPNFDNYNIFQKINLGISSTTSIYIVTNRYILLSLCILTIYLAYKNKSKFNKIISIFPLIIISCLNYFRDFFAKFVDLIPKFYNLFFKDTIMNNVEKQNIDIYVSSFIGVFIFILIVLSLYILFKDEKKFEYKIITPMILLIGLASRLIIGFSPTVFESGYRTNIFLEFSMIICIILLMQKYIDKIKLNRLIYILFIILCISQSYVSLKEIL